MSRWIKLAIASTLLTAVMLTTSQAQITQPRILSASIDKYARLQERLINRLRATTEPKQAYINRLVVLVANRKLDVKLVLALERKAVERRPAFPFPFFEQAVKIEAGKRGVTVLTVREYEFARNEIAR